MNETETLAGYDERDGDLLIRRVEMEIVPCDDPECFCGLLPTFYWCVSLAGEDRWLPCIASHELDYAISFWTDASERRRLLRRLVVCFGQSWRVVAQDMYAAKARFDHYCAVLDPQFILDLLSLPVDEIRDLRTSKDLAEAPELSVL